ncbi:MAG TPA: hypothetical protein PKG98_01160 [Myxococcota bacterium]|nr:hypothetical protein [Myxococcota bacterium]
MARVAGPHPAARVVTRDVDAVRLSAPVVVMSRVVHQTMEIVAGLGTHPGPRLVGDRPRGREDRPLRDPLMAMTR